MDTSFRLFPESASTVAGQVDAIYLALVGISLFFSLLIAGLIVFFGIRYRRGSPASRENPPTSILLEIAWSTIPLVVGVTVFFWGAVVFYEIRTPPPNALEIDVVAKQWMWKVQHPGGRTEINSLHIPIDQPVKLRMISEDVIHSFYIPAFRVKQDVLPGYYTSMWFQPTKAGEYHLFCAEYCGTEHSLMKGRVVVQSPTEYAAWLAEESTEPPVVAGAKLFDRFRCATCHKSEGGGNGPSLVGVFGKRVQLQGGRTVMADDQYLRNSLLNPQKDIVAGYQPLMPSMPDLTETDVLHLIAYLKTLTSETEAASEAVAPEAGPSEATPPEATTPETN